MKSHKMLHDTQRILNNSNSGEIRDGEADTEGQNTIAEALWVM
jgi:hypothetical protein